MQIPLQISWRNTVKSPTLEADTRERVAGFEQYYQPITSCRIMVEKPTLTTTRETCTISGSASPSRTKRL